MMLSTFFSLLLTLSDLLHSYLHWLPTAFTITFSFYLYLRHGFSSYTLSCSPTTLVTLIQMLLVLQSPQRSTSMTWCVENKLYTIAVPHGNGYFCMMTNSLQLFSSTPSIASHKSNREALHINILLAPNPICRLETTFTFPPNLTQSRTILALRLRIA